MRTFHAYRQRRDLLARILLAGLVVAFVPPDAAFAHGEQFPIEFPVAGQKIMIRGLPKARSPRRFVYKAVDDLLIGLRHDPAESVTILVRGTGENAGHSELIELDPSRWRLS